MQFPVPQFTDVEDKIIGPLTIKQFGIIFGVGVIVFLGYSVTKSLLVVIFLFFLLGLPALGLALVPFNGRPMYSFIGKLFRFLTSPKQLIFHKEVRGANFQNKIKDAEVEVTPTEERLEPKDAQAKMLQVEELLSRTASQEKDITERMR
ncbi:MAG TPA: PrgI family protein [Candidatus Limnocylindria bacterium]|nr:PrgI family protein [Candidatus Limnocylindria bacterium]